VAVTADVQETCEVQILFSSSGPGCPQRGNLPSRLLRSEPGAQRAGWLGSTRQQGSMCGGSACIVMNVSNLVFVTGLKTKTERK